VFESDYLDKEIAMKTENITIQQVKIDTLNPSAYNPRKWSDEAIAQLKDSIEHFGLVDPILVNSAPNRKGTVIGGHFRLKIAKDLGYSEVPVVFLNIPDEAKEKELNLRLNKAVGDWDYELLAKFDETLLQAVGFSSEELDSIFDLAIDEPEHFDLEKELEKILPPLASRKAMYIGSEIIG
jgi:ParB/RepB/Spo0J family partition protein